MTKGDVRDLRLEITTNRTNRCALCDSLRDAFNLDTGVSCGRARPTHALLPLEERPLFAVSAEAERLVSADSAEIKLAVGYVASTAQEAAREASSRAAAISRDVQPLPSQATLSVNELMVHPVAVRDDTLDAGSAERVLGQVGKIHITIAKVPAAEAEAVAPRSRQRPEPG